MLRPMSDILCASIRPTTKYTGPTTRLRGVWGCVWGGGEGLGRKEEEQHAGVSASH